MRNYYYFTCIILFLIFCGSLWIFFSRSAEFRNYHTAIAQGSTASTRNVINRYIIERRRLVSIFVSTNRKLVNQLIEEQSDEIKELVDEKLTEFFPNYFTFTIADNNGVPYFEDFDGLIGEQCLSDIKTFSDHENHFPKLHPNSEKYHFDIMVAHQYKDIDVIFFVSFDADVLGEILKNLQVPQHKLMLTIPIGENTLIEITENGSRIHIKNRLDFRLRKDEISRVLSRRKIEVSSWNVLDLYNPGLFSQYNTKLLIQTGVAIFLFCLTLLTMLIYLKREQSLKEKAENHKQDFLGVVSHELRTPLTAIKGSLGLVSNGITGKLNDKAQELIDIAFDNCNRLVSLVDDLLDVQKLESGKTSLERKPCNLSTCVNMSLKNIEHYGSQFGVIYHLTDLLPNTIVHIDENRFLQVMNNLLSNAAKYGGTNKTVDVSIIPYNEKVRISVTDYGEGIPEEFQGKIFEKFSQANQSTLDKVKSTGLGLHIVKQIIKLHNGKIKLFSNEKGTTFFIDMPIFQK